MGAIPVGIFTSVTKTTCGNNDIERIELFNRKCYILGDMYRLMHISDLHRSKSNPISNDELISCLAADSQRLSHERPSVALPDAIIVSGDLVSGLPLQSSDYPKVLEEQYSIAFDLLQRLTDIFVKGDRSKVIIIPGNHDADWNMAFTAMSAIAQDKQDILELISQQNTPYRWSWKHTQLFHITDQARYEERFKYFCDLYYKFYDGSSLTFSIDPKRDWNLFELDEGRILECAFNSCVEADCFNSHAIIPSRTISQSHLETINHEYLLRISLWHHDIQGDPRRSDYIDSDTIQLMIDRGYRLGMHGHRHKADALPISLHITPDDHRMAITSTGSLCADPSELPLGVTQQYNVVEIDDSYGKARIHVRDMRIPGIFGPGKLTALGGHSYADISWTPAPKNTLVNTGRGGGYSITLAEQIEILLKDGKYDDVVQHIEASGNRLGQYGKKLMYEALFKGEQWQRLKEKIFEPKDSDELTKLVVAIINLKDWPYGAKVLKAAKESGEYSNMLLTELNNRLLAEERMSK